MTNADQIASGIDAEIDNAERALLTALHSVRALRGAVRVLYANYNRMAETNQALQNQLNAMVQPANGEAVDV